VSGDSGPTERAVAIRAYRVADRAAVRAIAHRAGYMGEAADWYWRDATSFANVWTGYYTDREPESAFVAERAGAVVGYLLGCVDSMRAPSAGTLIAQQSIRRMLFFRPGTAGFLWRSLWDTFRRSDLPRSEMDDPRWPSHLHVNLLPEGRGCGAGASLMTAWLARLRDVGSPGCQLTTLAENRTAIAFFERSGFERLGAPVLVPGMRLRSGGRMHLQRMVRALS
jgi:ribosomal protein S18 acetylase RimI-like enzyme